MIVPESSLPTEITILQAVEAAYTTELAQCEEAVTRGLAHLVECDKEAVAYLYQAIRDRLRRRDIRCVYLDGRPQGVVQQGMPTTFVGTMIQQITNIVREGAAEDENGEPRRTLIVLPHLDLLVTSSGALTSEAREAIALLHENPRILWMGFKDVTIPLPDIITNLFPKRIAIGGVPRDRIQHLVTRREARKFGRQFDPFALYKHVSGVNAVRLRTMLGSISTEDYPSNPRAAFDQIRSATLGANLTLPDVDLDKNIGGYPKVKERLQKEILDVLAFKDGLETAQEVREIEGLIPRGIIFWGPPGTGKTLFAKAMATALGAAVIVVAGPELKSKWVGEAEERIRQVFQRARASAPAIIIFDELDSFAGARGANGDASGVNHSMVNQLLTEMDGFRKDELVFVVGTTNFVESLDQALLRPGRFELHVHIPWPEEKDREAIFAIYNKSMRLDMSAEALDYAVRRSGEPLEGVANADGMARWSGDHIQALCRQLARTRLRERIQRPLEVADVERALTQYVELPSLTPDEEVVIATHECGHAIVGMNCPNVPAIDRISIKSDIGAALGYVRYKRERMIVMPVAALLDRICTLYGGLEAERVVLEKLHTGAVQDIEHATHIARALVMELGYSIASDHDNVAPMAIGPRDQLSDMERQRVDRRVAALLLEQQQRARRIIVENESALLALRKTLLEKKVITAAELPAKAV